jgi:hypothetical protein
MKISEIISRLQDFQKQIGDRDIYAVVDDPSSLRIIEMQTPEIQLDPSITRENFH